MFRGVFRVIVLSALPVIGGVAPSTAREVPFASAQPIGGSPLGNLVLPGDLDGDADLDLVVPTWSRELYWQERNPAAADGFDSHLVYQFPAGSFISPAAVGDLDGDRDLDIAVFRENDEQDIYIDWFENDGTPGDGTWVRRNVYWWDAPFPASVYEASGLAIGDVDGDGDLDLVAGFGEELTSGNFNGRITWFQNDGSPANGGWTSNGIQASWDERRPTGLAVADIDRDGDNDVVAGIAYHAVPGPEGVYWYANDGTPAVGNWDRFQVTSCDVPDFELELTWWIDVGDPDSDGWPDLLVVDDNGWVSLMINDGTPAVGAWLTYSFALGGDARFTDVDRDGRVDIVADSPLRWFENSGPNPATWTERAINDLVAVDAVIDLDGDGDPDIAGASGSLYWVENLEIHRSAKLLDENLVIAGVDDPFDLLSADVDGDGDADLVSAAVAADRVYLHSNDGTPGNGGWLTNIVTALVDGVRAVAAGDLDRDGDLDLVSASYNDDAVAWYENDGTPSNGTWTQRLISTGAGGANDVVVADFDRDGDLDVACAQFLDDEISWYRNNGGAPPTFTPLFVDGLSFAGPRAVAVGDFDGNGFPDLASVSETGNGVAWYENDGTPADGEWARSLIASVAGPKELTVADLDRDGDSDVVVAAYGEDQVRWYENDGTPSGWTARLVSPCGGARSVDATDFDLDGDRDVLFSCYDDDAIWLARSNGGSPPSFTEWPVSVTAGGVRSVAAADLDRDGDLDGAAVQGGDDEVAWYENRGGQFRVLAHSIANDPLGGQPLEPVLDADVAHRGRSGDGLIEVSSFAVRFEEGAGDPLSAWQAAALMDAVQVYGDDGDSVFEPGVDPLLASAAPAGINAAGMVRINFADGLPEAAITALAEKTYFVVLDIASPIGDLAPDTLRVTLLTDGDAVCEAEDREHDIPLLLEHANNFSTATVGIVDLPLLFSDGFESGDTSAWSATVP